MKIGELVSSDRCNLLFSRPGCGGATIAETIIRKWASMKDGINEKGKILVVNPEFLDEITEEFSRPDLQLFNLSNPDSCDSLYINAKDVDNLINHNQEAIGVIIVGSLFFQESSEQLQHALTRLSTIWDLPIFLSEFRDADSLNRCSDMLTPVGYPYFTFINDNEGSEQILTYRHIYGDREAHHYSAFYDSKLRGFTIVEKK